MPITLQRGEATQIVFSVCELTCGCVLHRRLPHPRALGVLFPCSMQARLERVFSQERAEASLRIIDLTARHEKMLAQTMIQLGLS